MITFFFQAKDIISYRHIQQLALSYFVWDSCFNYVICIYLCILVSNTISMSDDVRIHNNNTMGFTGRAGITYPSENIDVPTRWLVSSVCSFSIFLCSVLFVISFLFFRQLSDLQFRSLITYVGSANFSSFNTLWLWTLFQPFNLMHLYFRQDTNVWGKARFISDLSPKKNSKASALNYIPTSISNRLLVPTFIRRWYFIENFTLIKWETAIRLVCFEDITIVKLTFVVVTNFSCKKSLKIPKG
jgi:hypothetical protein